MLIPKEKVKEILTAHHVGVNGVLHVGAHTCEEIPVYDYLGIPRDNVVWIEALESVVNECKKQGVRNIFQLVATDEDNQLVVFHKTNNVQSSSIFDFGTHSTRHPHVTIEKKILLSTTRLQTFLEASIFDPTKLDFWNLDIQGSELKALKGAGDLIKHAKVIYLEVNDEELYKGCDLSPEVDAYLRSFGFEKVHCEMTPHKWGDALYIKKQNL